MYSQAIGEMRERASGSKSKRFTALDISFGTSADCANATMPSEFDEKTQAPANALAPSNTSLRVIAMVSPAADVEQTYGLFGWFDFSAPYFSAVECRE
jgi:hypothetical protein